MGGVAQAIKKVTKSIKNNMKTISLKIEYAKSIGGVEKVTK